MSSYCPPDHDQLTEAEVRTALDFLVAIEPSPTPDSREAYEAAVRPYQSQIDAAMATIRLFAQQAKPGTAEQMQLEYYSFTNDPRYLTSAEVSAVVTGALNEAWHGVGSWQR